MTHKVQTQTPKNKLPVRTIVLSILAGVAAAAAIVGGQHLSRESEKTEKLEQAERTYRLGMKFMHNAQWRESIDAFDRALGHADLPKARTMKATALVCVADQAEAFALFSGEDQTVRSAYDRGSRAPPKEDEPTLRKQIEIIGAALAIEPTIKELWIIEGNTQARLLSVLRKKGGMTREDWVNGLDLIRKCYEEALRLDPNYDAAQERLSQPWLDPNKSW